MRTLITTLLLGIAIRGEHVSKSTSQYFDVRDFGVVCDGVTDDGPALAAMIANKPGGAYIGNNPQTWFFPGPFVTNQDLNFEGVILRTGATPTLKGDPTGSFWLGTGIVSNAIVVREGPDGFAIRRNGFAETIVSIGSDSHLPIYSRELAIDAAIPGFQFDGMSQDPIEMLWGYVNDAGAASVHTHFGMAGRVGRDGSGGYPQMFVTCGLPWDEADSNPIEEGGDHPQVAMVTSFRFVGKAQFRAPDGLQFSGLPVFADNAAATAGGLPVDTVYRTPTGVLMIRF